MKPFPFSKTLKKKLAAIKEKPKNQTISQQNTASLIQLDKEFYRQRYEDLRTLSDNDLLAHWKNHGFKEGRFSSAEHEAGDAHFVNNTAAGIKEETSPINFYFYTALYPDLAANGINTQEKAFSHFNNHGRKEGRIPNAKVWAKINHLPANLVADTLQQHLPYLAEHDEENLGLQKLLEVMSGESNYPIKICDNVKINSKFYTELARHCLTQGKPERAIKLLYIALHFDANADAYELLGNLHLDNKQYKLANELYGQALQCNGQSKWLLVNQAHTLAKLEQTQEALQLLQQSINRYPDFRPLQNKLIEITDAWWPNAYEQLMLTADTKNRPALIAQAEEFAGILYHAYLPLFGGTSKPPKLGALNTKKVLIIGDYHVAQCVRYRIDQKTEQLEAAGCDVTAIDWLTLDQHANELALHDVVIFYRVPAVPAVLKAMAQINATGKLSFYEIDDLLFDPVYPPAIESYGGYVELDTYRELTRGMALFNAAARFCRYGIASTQPLCDRLQQLVFGKQCLLHRNGLDKLNRIKIQDKSQKNTLDIFYGSGTQAHNSDFIELVLPALEKILQQFPRVRLVVVGYLQLPRSFTERFARQLSQLPPVASVQGYWSLLEQADINLAVLHDDEINACKSELKWFEAACFGIPSVLSTTANYRDVIRHGEDAFLVTSSQDWYNLLKQLAENNALRQTMGQAALARAQAEYAPAALGQQLTEKIAALTTTPRKRKLALVNVFFPPQSIGGATRVVDDNFKALRKHYHEDLDVCVFTADAECSDPHQLTVYEHQGARVYRASTLWRENMDWHPQDAKMYELFTEFLELEQPDIIHFHCVQRLTASIVQAAKDANIPYMVTAHDAWWISDFQFLVDHNGKVYPEGHPDPYVAVELPANISLADSITRKRDLKDLLHGAHKVLTVSNAFADIYRKNGIPQIEVIPNGISDELPWAPKQTDYTDKVVCAHIGGMAEHKGYYLLKQAVLEAQPENLEFLVVDHSKEEGYEWKSHWGKVPVTFIGRVNQNKIVDLYRRLDVLFAPSTWPESFGLVTREAAACGCWIVASNMGGIGEDIDEGKNGNVIECSTVSLKKQISNINKRKPEYKKSNFSKKSRTSSKQTEQLASIYLS